MKLYFSWRIGGPGIHSLHLGRKGKEGVEVGRVIGKQGFSELTWEYTRCCNSTKEAKAALIESVKQTLKEAVID